MKMILKMKFNLLFLFTLLVTSDNLHKASSFVIQDKPTSFFEFKSIERNFNGRITLDKYVAYSMSALSKVNGFDTDIHRYDSRQELISSLNLKESAVHSDFENIYNRSDVRAISNIELEQNLNDCGKELEWILRESKILIEDSSQYSRSTQLSLADLLDSFGKSSSQILMGNNWLLGSYEQCKQANLPSQMRAKDDRTRYCLAKVKFTSWTDRSEHLKIGLCLPRACSSLSYPHHSDKLEQLIKLVSLNQGQYNQFKLYDLYCLPSEDSKLRQFTYSAILFCSILISWFTLIVYYSLKYELTRLNLFRVGNRRWNKPQIGGLMEVFAFRIAWRNLFTFETKERENFINRNRKNVIKKLKDEISMSNDSAIDSVSDTSNDFQSLNSTSDSEEDNNNNKCNNNNKTINGLNRLNIVHSLNEEKNGDSLNGATTTRIALNHPTTTTTITTKSLSQVRIIKNRKLLINPKSSSSSSSVDLNVIDGIKVISMLWLIAAHSLLYLIRSIANGREFWFILRDARFMTLMAGIFPVDSFFTITGVLTTFLRFNKGHNLNQFKEARYWLETFYHRYARLMPMYLIIFWYTRDLSEYIGSGPMWDYGTSNSSIRWICKHESITEAITLRANLKPLQEHCVKPAWYLASDFQFLLVTPIYLIILVLSNKLGQLVIISSIIFSLIAQFLTVFLSKDIDDFETLINFKPMFGTYVLGNLWKLYVLPYNRICPYLIGLLTGYYIYKRNKTDGGEEKEARITTTTTKSRVNIEKNFKTEISSYYSFTEALKAYLGFDVWCPLICLISLVYLPTLSFLNTYHGIEAKIGTSAIIALMRFVWSIAIARLIYVCTFKTNGLKSESFVKRLLSSTRWRPWSKIGLSTLLIQWEVISYLSQIQTNLPNMTIAYLLSTISIATSATYLIALIVYLTIEYPISKLEQLYIHPILFPKKQS